MPPAPTAILESALYADDLDAAEAFYASVLGLAVALRDPGRFVFFRLERAMLLVFATVDGATGAAEGSPYPVPAHGARGPGHLCFAATAEEIDGWVAHLEAAGVAVEADFRWPGGARSIYFRDPAGNSLEIAETRLWFSEPTRYEVWFDLDGCSATLASAASIADQREKGLLSQSRFMWAIEAANWEEAQAIHHLRMGYEPHVPEGEPQLCPQGCGCHYYPDHSGQCPVCGRTV